MQGVFSNLIPQSPGAIQSSFYDGTMRLPIETTGEKQFGKLPEFGLDPSQLPSQEGIVKPKPIFQARPIKALDGATSIDIRHLSRDQALDWMIQFTNGMHRNQFENWNMVPHRNKAKNYPKWYQQELVEEGMNPELVEKFEYVHQDTYLYVDADENINRQVITELDLDKMEARLQVVENGRGITMKIDERGVTQESSNVVLSKESFARFFGFGRKAEGEEMLKRSAQLMYEDQFAELGYLIQSSDLQLIKGDEELMRSELEPGEYDRYRGALVAQARVVASFLGLKQSLVKVNAIYTRNHELLFEVIINRARTDEALVSSPQELDDRSFPVRGRFKTYLGERSAAEMMQNISAGRLSFGNGAEPLFDDLKDAS